jgi:hypothetical protein
LESWDRQNAAQFSQQQQRAQSMATSSASQPQLTNLKPNIPAGASPELKAYLTAQAALSNARAQLHNQLVGQAGQSLTSAQMAAVGHQENVLFQQQNLALLNLQAQRSRALAGGLVPAMAASPAPLVIPPGASSQMAAFLKTRYQIRQGLAQLEKQYAHASQAEREAALENWYQQNAGQFALMRQQAQTFPGASPPTAN